MNDSEESFSIGALVTIPFGFVSVWKATSRTKRNFLADLASNEPLFVVGPTQLDDLGLSLTPVLSRFGVVWARTSRLIAVSRS